MLLLVLKHCLRCVDKQNVLGQGNFGIVYGGVYKGENVALKTTKDEAGEGDDHCNVSLLAELKVLAFLTLDLVHQHPFIVQLVGTYTEQCTDTETDNKLYLVVEECLLGNLHSYLERHRPSCLVSEIGRAHV